MTAALPDQLRDRLRSLDRVLSKLEGLLQRENPEEAVVLGSIHLFEIAVELFWKSMKDALMIDGVPLASPKPVLRKAGESGWVDDVTLTLEMINLRNETTHRYDQGLLDAVREIRSLYAPAMRRGQERLLAKLEDDPDA